MLFFFCQKYEEAMRITNSEKKKIKLGSLFDGISVWNESWATKKLYQKYVGEEKHSNDVIWFEDVYRY